MTETWKVLLPKQIDPSGPESIAGFADCTGMDEYGSYDDALADIDAYDAVIVRVAPLDGAALDTFKSEPSAADHPLYDRADVLLTPHVGGVTTQALARLSRQAGANVRAVYEGGIPDATCNREALEVGA